MFRDLRTAWRSLRRAPALAATAALTIALGVAANAVAFAWFKGVALDPLPGVRDARALVHLRTLDVATGDQNGLSYPNFVAWREGARTLAGAAAFSIERLGVRTAAPGGAARTEQVWGNLATGDYFTTLGVRPAVGRFWRPDEASAPGGAAVAVLSDALWRRAFGADPAAVGRTVWVNGTPCTVIGVAPPDFGGAFVGLRFEVWLPLALWPRVGSWTEKLERRETQWLHAFARPRAGLAVVNAELRAVGARVAAAEPGARGVAPVALPFDRGIVQGMLAPLFGLLVGAAAVVQLVVCANVANLLLARAAARERELATRAALGAGRRRLVGELAAEGVLLSAAGSAAGVAAAGGAGALLRLALPALEVPVALNVGVDGRVLATGVALALGTALLAGLAPALRATAGRRAPAAVLARGARGSTRPGATGRPLVVAQLALAFVAVAGAALFARSLAALAGVDVGLRAPDRVLVAFTDLALAGRRPDPQGRAALARWLDAVRALPGVEAATLSDFVPLGLNSSNSGDFVPTGYQARPGESVNLLFNAVGDGYFEALGVPVVRGRPFDARDGAGAPRVAIVNEAYARRFLRGRDPVGATADYGRDGRGAGVRIVGVARDGRYAAQDLAGAPAPFVYVPYAQHPTSSVFVQVRARPGVDPLTLVPGVRRALEAADPALPLVQPTTLARWARAASFVQRLGAAVLAVLGAVALLLAAVGLYAVTAYAVARRTREIGVRVALGATARRVLAEVLGAGGRTAAAGLVAGAVLALGAARLVRAQLFGVSPADPVTFAGASVLLLAVSTAAAWLPARRAARVDPTVALREE